MLTIDGESSVDGSLGLTEPRDAMPSHFGVVVFLSLYASPLVRLGSAAGATGGIGLGKLMSVSSSTCPHDVISGLASAGG